MFCFVHFDFILKCYDIGRRWGEGRELGGRYEHERGGWSKFVVSLGLRQRDRGQRRGWGVQGRKAVLSMGNGHLDGGGVYLLVNVSQCCSGARRHSEVRQG